MLDGIKINFNEISWYLWVVVISALFLFFSLKYNIDFVYFGFITFVYGIIGHVVFKSFDEFKIGGNKRIWIRIILEIITIGMWLYFLIMFV